MPEKSLEELKSMVGESRVRTVDLEVEAGKVEEFARATRDDNPIHRDEDAAREAGYRTVPAPLIFTRVSRFPRYQPDDLTGYLGFDIGIDPGRILHGEQEYSLERPVYVGDVLTGTTTLSEVYERESSRMGTLTFLIFDTDYVDQNDELVLTERLTVIETGPEEDSS